LAGITEATRKQWQGDPRQVQKIPLLLTRPEGANTDFKQHFPKDVSARLEMIDCPLIRIKSLLQQTAMAGDAAAVFTSSNGVRFAPPPLGRRAYCVGERTTQAAQNGGWAAVCAGQDAEALTRYIIAQAPSCPLYHFSGVHVRGDVVGTLIKNGITATRVALYDQHLLPLSAAARRALEGKTPVIVPLFSPRAATLFAAEAPPAAPVLAIALSPAVAEAAKNRADFETVVAAEPTASAVMSAIETLLHRHPLG
jgi:uroporphyrinogen-III synthase